MTARGKHAIGVRAAMRSATGGCAPSTVATVEAHVDRRISALGPPARSFRALSPDRWVQQR